MNTKDTLDIILGHVSLACAEMLRGRAAQDDGDSTAATVQAVSLLREEARKLERERDEARAEARELSERFGNMRDAIQLTRAEVARLRDELGSKVLIIHGHVDRHTQLREALGARPGESALDAACRVLRTSKEYEGRIFELGRLLSQASAAGSDEVAGE